MRSFWSAGLRLIRTRPGFAITVAATLAIPLGVIAAVFGVMDRLLVQPLPFSEPQRIVHVENSWPLFVDGHGGEPASNAGDAFAHLAQYEAGRVSVGGPEPRMIRVARVTGEYFPVLRVPPAAGTVFSTAAARTDNAHVVVLSEALARGMFNTPGSALGKPVTINGRVHTVSGVLPERFPFYVRGQEIDAWVRFDENEGLFRTAQLEGSGAIGRLTSGLTINDAQARLETVFRQLAQERPEWKLRDDDRMRLVTLRDHWFGNLRLPLVMLFAAAGCLFAIACANTIGLMLAREAARRRDTAIRAALGAGRMQLARDGVAENLLLGLIATVAGLVVAHWGAQALLELSPTRITHADELGVNARVVLFALVIAIPAACASALIASWRASRGDLAQKLGAGARAGTFVAPRMRQTIVVVQVAITVVLLVNGGLLLRSFRALRYESTGFNARNVLTLEIAPAGPRFPDGTSRLIYYRQILERVRTVPGVQHVAMVNYLPIYSGSLIVPVSVADRADADQPTWTYRAATPDYFATMRIPLLAGRSFTDADLRDRPPVMVVDSSAAAMFGTGRSGLDGVIGRRVTVGAGEPITYEIVGIVGDVRQQGLGIRSYPGFYVSAQQRPPAVVNLVVRTSSNPELAADGLRTALRRADPDLPVATLSLMESHVSETVSRRRFAVVLSGILAVAAFVISIVGLSALMSQFVVHRTHEIGVRVAMGARPADVLRLVLQQAGGMAGVGVAAGIAAALATSRLLDSLLYGVAASDPLTFVAVPLLVAAASTLACTVPVRRALAASPLEALRRE